MNHSKARPMRLSMILLIFFCFSKLMLAQMSVHKEMDLALSDIQECLSKNLDCLPKFAEAQKHATAIKDDTTAANYFLELAKVRQDAGQWDSLSQEFIESAIGRLEKKGLECELVKPYFDYTRFSLFQSDPEETLSRAKKTNEIAEQCGLLKHKAHANCYIGAAYIDLSDYASALTYLNLAEEQYSELKDSSGLAMVLLDKSIVYGELDDAEISLQMLVDAADIYKNLGNEMRYAIAKIDYCTQSLDMEQTDGIEIQLEECIQLVDGKHEMATAYVYQNYGRLYTMQGRCQKAMPYIEKALNIIKLIGDPFMEASLERDIARCYLDENKPKQAFPHALHSDSITKMSGRNKSRLQSLELMAEVSNALGDEKTSIKAYQEFISLNDSLLGAEKLKEIVALEKRFELQKKEQEIKMQQQENALLKEQNRAATIRNIALGLSLLLLIFVGLAFFIRQRAKVKQQQSKLKLRDLENEKLNSEIELKNRALTSNALHIAQKNEIISSIKGDLSALDNTHETGINKLINKLNFEEHFDDSWSNFSQLFTEVNPTFYTSLKEKYPTLTKGEMRMAALMKMNLGSKDIAQILNITNEGVKKARYRMRKKIGLDSAESLEELIFGIK